MAINRYTNAIQNTQEQYVPLPFDEMLKAGQTIQARGDLAEEQQMKVQTGLSSMEALAPGYQKFRDNFVGNYKKEAGSLLDKYGSNTSNPEFIRDMKRLNMQYAADPRLQTIKQGNELYKQNAQIAAKMKAEGKLYVQPKFTGVDDNGNLTDNVPGVEAVNTLEDWTNSAKVAHESMEDIGMKTTNARNLKNWKNSIMSDTAGQTKLRMAYMQQGMSADQADKAVQSNIQGLANTYGKVDKLNLGLMQYQLSVQAQQDAHADRQDAIRARHEAAAAKGGKQPAEDVLPTVRNDDRGFATGVNKDGDNKNSQFVPTFGSSTINKPVEVGGGRMNFAGGFFRQNAEGESYNGVIKKQMGSANIKKATFEGVHNVAVTPDGDLITSKTKGEFVMKNGKQYYKTKDNAKMIEAKPMSMEVYTDKATGSVYYAPASQQQAMRYMGATGAYWDGKKTALQSYGYHAKDNQPLPQDLQQAVGSFNLNDPNVANKLETIGAQRGYDSNTIRSVFGKAASGQKLKISETSILDNILSDANDLNDYYKFNKGEFDNQGKAKNIYSSMFNQSTGNANTAKSIDTETNEEE